MTCLETALRYPAPIAAYPIMIGSDGVLIPVASLGFLKSGRFAPGALSASRSAVISPPWRLSVATTACSDSP